MPFLKRRCRPENPRAKAGRLSVKTGLRRAVFFPGGGKFVGEWRDGLRHGQGAHHFDSRLYEGGWKRDLWHGHGVLSTKVCDGTYNIDYAGDWVQGKKHGKGVQHFPDGGFYEGSWECNKRSGHGRMWFPDNTFYEGNWLNNKFHGLGWFVQANGNCYEGHWKDGLQHGFVRFYHLHTGQLQEGLWHNGIAVRSTIADIYYRQSALHPTPYPIRKVELKDSGKETNEIDEARMSFDSERKCSSVNAFIDQVINFSATL